MMNMIKCLIKYFILHKSEENYGDKRDRLYNVKTLPDGGWTEKVETSDGRKWDVTFHNLGGLIERYSKPFDGCKY